MSIPRVDRSSVGSSKIQESKPPVKKAEVKAEPAVAKKSPVELRAEANGNEKSNAGPLGALADNFKDPKAKDAKEGKDAQKPADAKQVQQQLDKLQQELKEAQARGDKEAVARLSGEIAKLQQQLQGNNPPANGATQPDGAAPVGGNQGGATPVGNGGGTPAGGGSAPSGGGAPSGGAAPSGGSPGAGGANEAGAGQGAGAGKEEVDQFIQFAAQSYGANPKVLSEIARRESNFNTGDIANNWDSNAKKGNPSKGMFQFIEPTFKSMMPQAKAANPGAWQGVTENWTDWKAQALTTAWAITNGKGSHWSTYQAAVNTAGGGGGTRTA